MAATGSLHLHHSRLEHLEQGRNFGSMEKKILLAMSMILLIISANMDRVKPQGVDCYDSCSTGCVNPDERLMARCDRKCQIKCSPGLDNTGHFK